MKREIEKVDGEYLNAVEQQIYTHTFSGALLRNGVVRYSQPTDPTRAREAMWEAKNAVRWHRAGFADAMTRVDSPKNPLFGTFASPEFKLWPEQVRGVVEANDFERHVLWKDWSGDSGCSPSPLKWEQINGGTAMTLHGSMFDTNVSLMCAKINGQLVLFWYCISSKCDHDLARDWIEASFPNAVEHSDAGNFHAVVNALTGL